MKTDAFGTKHAEGEPNSLMIEWSTLQGRQSPLMIRLGT